MQFDTVSKLVILIVMLGKYSVNYIRLIIIIILLPPLIFLQANALFRTIKGRVLVMATEN